MTVEEAKKELEAFKDFKFFPEDHHYEFNGKKVGISVTRFIEQYANEFDKDKISMLVARKTGKTQEQILSEWEYKNNFACEKGTNGHNFAQSCWNGELVYPSEFDSSDAFKMANNSIFEQGKNFYNDFCEKLEHLADEFVVGSEEYDIASAIDHLFINKITGGLVLVDYKTNTELEGYNKKPYDKNKKMKAPINNLQDTKIVHYYIQLSIYRYLIEKYTNLKVSEVFIVYMTEKNKNYEIIDIPYLKEEVKKILEWRKWE